MVLEIMEWTPREALLRALEDLDIWSFNRFRNKLSNFRIEEGYSQIPRARLENTDCKELVYLILGYYSDEYGVRLTVDILNDIGQKRVAEQLARFLKYPIKDVVRFVNRHSINLIREVTVVDPILDDLLQKNLLTKGQYHEIRSSPTSRKMRELFKYVRDWSDSDKVILYELLRQHNERLIEYLNHQDKQPQPPPPPSRKMHFLELHRQELIQSITMVDPILDSLVSENLLTSEMCNIIKARQTSLEKMRELFNFTRWWNNAEKDTLYDVIKKWNHLTIVLLEEKDMTQILEPKLLKRFVDRHRQDLVNWVYTLPPVLDSLLEKNLLTNKQRDSICSKTTPQQKMLELYSCVEGWGDGDKNELYDSLGKYNRLLIRDLEYQDMGWPLTTGFSSMSLDQSKWTPKDLLLYSLEYLLLDEFRHFKKQLSVFVYDDIPPIPLEQLEDAHSMSVSDLLIDRYGHFTALAVMVEVLISVGLVGLAEELQEDIKLCGLRTPEVILMYILDELEQYNFMQFKNKLFELHNEDKRPIPRRLIDSADRITTVDLLILLYGKQEALNVTVQILQNINVMRLARDLENWVSPQGSKKHLGSWKGEAGPSKVTNKSSAPQPGSSKDFDFQAGNKSEPDQSEPSSVTGTGAEAQVSSKEKNAQSERESSDLNNEMKCSICLEILSDPTTMMCGHNFCMKCIETALDNQDKQNLFCPLCKQKFKDRPKLKINCALREVARFFKSRWSKPRNRDLNCSYCIQGQVTAVKSCLLCETSLCDEHLHVHSKSEEHVLIEPTTSFKERKCSLHNKVLEHYCTDDHVCVCSWCCIYGEYRGHHVEMVTKAAEKQKNELRNVQEELTLKIKQADKLLNSCREAQTAADMEMVGKLLEVLELQVPGDPSTQEDQASLSVSDLIQKAEERRDQLSQQIGDIMNLCQETNPILVLQDRKNGSEKYTVIQESTAGVSSLIDMSSDLQPDLCSKSLESDGEVVEIFPEASSSSPVDEVDCDLCGKDYDPDDTLVVPDINGNSYRLELKSAGLFRCSETGIKFQVNHPATIEYELDSWSNYMEHLKQEGSEVLGPLFNIKTPREPHIVSAVYLPHYLCLKELSKDVSWIRCAHFTDGNLSVEKPTRILPFHVVLENPSFSSFGVFCWNALPNAWTKHIAIHGRVLLYFREIGQTCMEYQLHLYLVPRFAPISKDFEKEKMDLGFVKVLKPSRTKRRLYTEKNYIVNGPEEAHIEPTELEVQCISPSEDFTDITIDAAVRTIDLCLTQEDSANKVWGCHVSTGEIEELRSQSQKRKRSKDQKELVDEDLEQPSKSKMESAPTSTQQLLLKTLQGMEKKKLKQFRQCLTNKDFFNRISNEPMTTSELEDKDEMDVTDLLIRRYTKQKVVHVTLLVLEEIGEKELARKLRLQIHQQLS